jgi:tRNA(adenine34) deaminase
LKNKTSEKQKERLFMQKALLEAEKALNDGEVPIGAVLTKDGKIISTGRNRCIADNDPSAHAEIIALRKGAKKLKNYRLNDCSLYVTIEPCAMCAGALINARVAKIVFGALDKKAGACQSVFKIADGAKLNHKIIVERCDRDLSASCAGIIKDFFLKKRAQSRLSKAIAAKDKILRG